MTTPLAVLPVYKALVTGMAEATGKPAGRGKLVMLEDDDGRPTDKADLPQTVLYVEGDARLEETWSLDGHLGLEILCRCTGRRADQVEWLADKVRAAWLGRTGDTWTSEFPVEGMQWMSRDVSTGPLDVERQDVFSRPLTLRMMLSAV